MFFSRFIQEQSAKPLNKKDHLSQFTSLLYNISIYLSIYLSKYCNQFFDRWIIYFHGPSIPELHHHVAEAASAAQGTLQSPAV